MFLSDDPENEVNKDKPHLFLSKTNWKIAIIPKENLETEKEVFYLNGLNSFPGFIT